MGSANLCQGLFDPMPHIFVCLDGEPLLETCTNVRDVPSIPPECAYHGLTGTPIGGIKKGFK